MPILLNEVQSSNTDDFKNYPATESFDIDLDDILLGDSAISMENEYTDALLSSLRATYEATKANDMGIVYEGFVDNAKEIIGWFQQWLINFKNAIVKYFKKLYQKVAKFKFKASKIAANGFVPVEQFMVKGYDYTFDYGNFRVPEIINDIMHKTNLAVDSIKNHKENLEVVVNRFCNDIGNATISIYRGMLVGEDFVDAEYYDDALFRHFHAGADRGDKKDILITTPALRNYIRQVKNIQNAIKNCENDKERLKNDTERIINWLKSQAVYTPKETYHFEDEDKFSDNRVARALSSVYNHANNMIKRAHFICSRYYSEKLHTLDEAIRFYDYVMGRAQDKFYKPLNEEATDYTKLDDSAYYSINEAMNSEMVDLAISELYFLGEAWEAKQLVIEADNNVQVGVNKAPITRRRVTGLFGNIKETIRKIIAFIMNALEKFQQAVSDLLKTDVQWVIDNNAMLNNLPPQVLQTMTLNYTNYMHTNAHQRIAERNLPTNGSLRTIATRIGNEAVKAKQAGRQLDGAMTCYKNYFPQLYKLDPNNWKNAALMYYRGGSNGSYLPPERKRPGRGETVMARGADCQQVIKNMCLYVLNYKQYAAACTQTLNALKGAMNEQNNILNQLAKERATLTNEADISNATFGPDMYSILENSNIFRTDLVSMDILTKDGLKYLREELGNGAANPQHPIYMTGGRPSQAQAQQQAAQQQQAQQQQAQQQQQKPVQMQPKQQNPQQQQNAQQNDYASDASRQLIAAYQVCSSICTAKLTVCEEIERSYMRVLRGVAAAVQKYNGDNDQERSNRQYNRERQEDRQAAQDERLQKIRFRNQQKKARNTGLIGGMKNILGV